MASYSREKSDFGLALSKRLPLGGSVAQRDVQFGGRSTIALDGSVQGQAAGLGQLRLCSRELVAEARRVEREQKENKTWDIEVSRPGGRVS